MPKKKEANKSTQSTQKQRKFLKRMEYRPLQIWVPCSVYEKEKAALLKKYPTPKIQDYPDYVDE